MDFLQTYLQQLNRGQQSKPKVQQFIRREDLNKKKAASLKVKKKVHFESKPLIQNDEISKKHTDEGENAKEGEVSREKPAVQVKILMTKEEANRLLSKSKKNGGTLQFEDVANVLVDHAFSSNKKDH